MNRTDVTYSQLDEVLRSLGFTFRMIDKDGPTRAYMHVESGAVLLFFPYPETDFVYAHHLVGARTTADLFGLAEPKDFDALLARAAETNGASRPATPKKRRKPTHGQ